MPGSPIAQDLASQVLGALSMLKDCLHRCPDRDWQARQGDRPFSQVAFHALFDCDYHLDDDEVGFKAQAFHLENREVFADYGELRESIPERLYDRAFIAK